MSVPFKNMAAWLMNAKAHPFVIKEAPVALPGADEVLVRNHAVAVNSVDYKLQTFAFMPFDYPIIWGLDTAGDIVAVGPNVTHFRVGDRVCGTPLAFSRKRSEEATYQNYTLLHTNMTSKIPDSVSYVDATVLPIVMATAASALFEKNSIGLDRLPTVPAQPKRTPAEVVFVWGGASGVGLSAIQLSVAAGYQVVTTASAKNFDLVRSAGASQVLDYHNTDTVVADLVALFAATGPLAKARLVGIFDTIGGDALAQTAAFAKQCSVVIGGDTPRHIITTIPVDTSVLPDGITASTVFAYNVANTPVSLAIFEDFLPKALQTGSIQLVPKALVFGNGLESIQGAVDRIAQGVSGQKLVVTL